MPRDAVNEHLYRHNNSKRYWRYGGGPWQYVGLGSSTSLVRELVLPSSVSNPVREDRTRAQSPYSVQAARLKAGVGTAVFTESAYPIQTREEGTVVITNRGNQIPDHTLAQRYLADSRNKALAGLSEGRMQMNAALAELRGTVKSLTSYYNLASKGVRKMFKDFPKKTQERLKYTPAYNWKDIPSDYLGYLYGIAPLADDIANGATELSGMAKRAMAYGYWVRSGRKSADSYMEPLRTASGSIQYQSPGTRTSFARVGYYFDFPLWWIESTPILTPFSTAWELTRLSFVVDWVLPMGNYIGALESAGQFGPYFKEGYEVYGTEEECTGGNYSPAPNMPRGTVSVVASDYYARRFSAHRSVLDRGDGWRLFQQVKFPSFRNELGLGHAAQAASLFAQRFHKPPASWFR